MGMTDHRFHSPFVFVSLSPLPALSMAAFNFSTLKGEKEIPATHRAAEKKQ